MTFKEFYKTHLKHLKDSKGYIDLKFNNICKFKIKTDSILRHCYLIKPNNGEPHYHVQKKYTIDDLLNNYVPNNSSKHFISLIENATIIERNYKIDQFLIDKVL